MKKRILLFAILILASAANAQAGPIRDQRWDAGFNMSGYDARSNNIGESLYFSGGVSYGMNEILGLGVSGGYSQVGFTANPPSGLVEGPDLTVTPVFGDIILRVPTGDKPFTPYAIFGFGAMISHATGTDTLLNRNTNTRSDNAFASKVGGGLDWQANARWLYNFEIGMVFTGARLVVFNSSTGAQIESNDLDFWYIGGGVKYLFD